MNGYRIPLSKTPLRRHIILGGVLVVLACVVITFFFHYAVSVAPTAQQFLIATLWISMAILWAMEVLMVAKRFSSKSYILGDEALSIKKKGWFGRGSERLYRYDAIVSVNSMSRAHGAYGSVELIFDRQPPVVIFGIVLPDEHARRIKKLVVDSRSQR